MSDVIDLNAERNKREQPDEQFIRRDDFGRQMCLFLLSYEMDHSSYHAEVWAYDFADAEKRVQGMRGSLRVLGQAYGQEPA